MYASICYSNLFKCITKYRLYKLIEPLQSICVPKLIPGYGTVSFVQIKKRENNHGGVFLLSKLQPEVFNFTRSNE